MTRTDAIPVVRPLPGVIVKLGVAAFYIIGSILLWNDRRIAKAEIKVHKPQSSQANGYASV